MTPQIRTMPLPLAWLAFARQAPFWCSMSETPILIEPAELEAALPRPDLCVVDLAKAETYAELHVPGAIHLDYPMLLAGTRPAPGLLPENARLAQLAGLLGLDRAPMVVAYDNEGGGRAARLLWTLHYLGYFNAHVLNGGIHAWSNEGHPVTAEPVARPPARALPLDAIDDSVLATRDYVLTHLDDAGVALLDARTPEEYAGSKISAKRGGHIPGAINLNWHDSMDQARNLRLKPAALLEELLASRGINLEQEVIVYCQTHHRSAHTWMMLKSLGYGRVRGYAGSWSEWGNDPTTPVAQN